MKLRKLICLLLVLAMIPGLAAAAPEPEAEPMADLSGQFSDAALLGAVRQQLGLEDGAALTAEALGALTWLRLDTAQAKVASFDGIELAENLEAVSLYYVDADDMEDVRTALTGVTVYPYLPDAALEARLKELLEVSGPHISLAQLDAITSAFVLDLSGTEVRSWEGLQWAKGLSYSKVTLPAMDAQLTAAIKKAVSKRSGDLTWYDLRRLTTLDLQDVAVGSLEGLQWAVNLADLFVDTCAQVTDQAGNTVPALGDDDMAILRDLPIRQLQLENTAVTRIPATADKALISRLDLRNNRITDLSPVSGMKNLGRLVVGGQPHLRLHGAAHGLFRSPRDLLRLPLSEDPGH